MATPLPTFLPARFEIAESLGDSPFERTYRAYDKLLQREVMLKLPSLAADATWSASVRERLLREARAMAKIRHDGVAAIHWIEETPEGPLLVLDLPAGELLAERLQRGPLDVDETIALGIAIAEALAQVHMHGVVHRAVGPAAIRLLAKGQVQLGSFTFAKEFGNRGQASSLAHGKRLEANVVRFLPDYSAPEQLAGQAADPRADVFALGCTLFRCLAGREAFLPGHEHEPMPDLRKLRREVGKPLAEVIRKCALHAKTARYATAQEVVDALVAARAAGTPKGVGGRGLLVGAAAFVAVGLAAVFGRGLWPSAVPEVRADRGDESQPEDTRYHTKYGPDYARLFGLFIGIGKGYASTPYSVLTNPVPEVTAVSEQLRSNDPQWAAPGAIKVLPDADATLSNIFNELDRIQNEAAAEDGVLIYFSGHGVRSGQSFGLCAKDVSGSVENGTGFLRREVLNTYLDRIKAKHVLVILDCCHSGAVFDVGTVGKSRGRPLQAGRDVPGAQHRGHFSREYLCSAGATQEASDGIAMSPFCQFLLEQLRQPASATNQYKVARFLSSHIAEAMDQRVRVGALQMPRFRQMDDQQGSFVFKLRKADAPK